MSRPGPIVLGVLGTPLVRDASGAAIELSAQNLRLLIRLHLGGGQGVSDGALVQDLWAVRTVGQTVLKAAANRLRRALDVHDEVVRRTHQGYSVDLTTIWCDAATFESLVARARRSEGSDAIERYDEALALWRGQPFAGMADEPWLQAETERLVRLRTLVREQRASALLADGQATRASLALSEVLAEDPYRERSIELLVRALYLGGDPVQALATLRSSVQRMRDDLGLEPTSRLRDLEHAVLSHAPVLGAITERADAAHDSGQLDAMVRSADTLRRAGALEDAVRVLGRAVAIARSAVPRRVAELLARRSTLLALVDRAPEGLVDLAEATRLARRDLDGPSLAQVALARFGFDAAVEDHDELLVQLLEPVDLLPPGASQRVDLLCAAMHQIVYSADSATAEKLLADAERTARSIGDQRSSAIASASRAFLSGVRHETLDDQLTTAEAAVTAARSIGEPLLSTVALLSQVRALFDAGRMDDCRAASAELRVAAEGTSLPFAWLRPDFVDAAVRLAKGDVEGLEETVVAIGDRGARMHVRSASGSTHSLLFGVWLELDRLELLHDLLTDRGGAAARVWDALSAMIAATLGRPDATDRLDHVVRGCIGEARGGWREPFEVAFAIEAAWRSGHVRAAESLVGRLDALAGRFLVLGPGTITIGPADRFRGLASLTAGDAFSAVQCLRAASICSERGGATVWALRSRIELAQALRARGEPGDHRESDDLLAAVAQAVSRCPSPRLARELVEAVERRDANRQTLRNAR